MAKEDEKYPLKKTLVAEDFLSIFLKDLKIPYHLFYN